MDILYAIKEMRTPFLDVLMSIITYLGDQTVLLGVGLFVMWCVDKRWGYRLFYLGLLGAAVNQLLKALFVVPRPWVIDPAFEIVESARAGATGYSFPSGHTQGAVMLLGALAVWRKKRAYYILAVCGVLLVGFSRMYLGVHTLTDVLVSIAVGGVILFAANALFDRAEKNEKLLLVAAGIAVVAALFTLFYATSAAGAESSAVEFDTTGIGDTYSLFGGLIGLILMYIIDTRYINFKTDAVWWAQLIKCVGGIALVMAVRLLLKAPLNALFHGHAAANAVRYFLMAAAGGILWPLTFPLFQKLGKR